VQALQHAPPQTRRRKPDRRSPEVSDIEKSVERILKSYESAVYAKDVGAFIQLYDPAVRVFDTWGVWSHEGSEAWQRAIEGWFMSLGTERVKVRFDDLRTLAGQEFASVSAIVTYAAVSAEGAPLRSMQNRLSWVLRTSGHVLRIVHEHTSAPVGFDDAKAILQRERSA
jgi:ketosteroid isomerase-like protein